jgi:hypothetical protein
MKKIQMRVLFGVIILVATICSSLSYAALLFGEGITKNANGDYIITYMSPENQQLVQTLYVPPDKIIPLLKSRMTLDHDWKIIYRYTVTNRKDSRQPLVGLTLDPISAIWQSNPQQDLSSLNNGALFIPADWDGFVMANSTIGYRANWIYGKLEAENDGLHPGQTQTGFGFMSLDLPGVQVAELDGHGTDPAFLGEPDEDIVALYDQLVKDTSFVPRPAAVPAIAVPNPFDAAVLLDRIQAQMHTWIGMKLLDATFSSQLDRYLTSAADAYRHNQPKAAKDDIETIHKMLMSEHRDLDQENAQAAQKDNDKDGKRALIDLLAAQVLDFNLQYVVKRAGN